MPSLFLYDEDPTELRPSAAQLRRHGFEGKLVSTYLNRLDLFDAIAGSDERSIALVDLQTSEQLDSTYSGCRVIETIARHPTLQTRCVPVAFTVHAREDIIELARRHRAAALISKNDLDDLRAVGGLASLVERLLATPEPDFEVFPTLPPSDTDGGEARQVVSNMLVDNASIVDSPYFWSAMRYVADKADKTSITHWVADDYGITSKAVAKHLEGLASVLAPRYRTRDHGMIDFARDLFERVPHQRPAPAERDLVRLLPRLSALDEETLLGRHRWVDAEASGALRRVLAAAPALTQRQGHGGQWIHTQDIEQAIADVERDPLARHSLRAAFVRGVNGVFDSERAESERA